MNFELLIFKIILKYLLVADDQTCGANEEFNNCGTQCQRTCADINGPQKLCNHMCAIGCFCTNGYVRQNDQNSLCIKETEC